MLTTAIASSDLTSSAQLLAGLEQTGMIKSVVQWTVPAERMPDAATEIPDIVFLDLARDPEPFFVFATQLRRIHPGIKLIACSAAVPLQPNLLLEAMRSGVQDFIRQAGAGRRAKENPAQFRQDLHVKISRRRTS